MFFLCTVLYSLMSNEMARRLQERALKRSGASSTFLQLFGSTGKASGRLSKSDLLSQLEPGCSSCQASCWMALGSGLNISLVHAGRPQCLSRHSEHHPPAPIDTFDSLFHLNHIISSQALSVPSCPFLSLLVPHRRDIPGIFAPLRLGCYQSSAALALL